MSDTLKKMNKPNPKFKKEIQMMRDVKFVELNSEKYKPLYSGWPEKECITKLGEL